ncbi:MAG: pitrilysin family protein [Thiohalomonadales bacterium]|nr:pitrilysin family protein [Thiohalomonadales bacterium]
MLKLAMLWLAGFALLVPLPGIAQVHETKLSNGMQVLVKEDHRAPVVVSQVWYKVGSSYEDLGITGISHVLEHMMFKGTAKHPAGEFSRIIAENGGSENAFTGRDYTAYFQQLEKSRLPISMKLEADRMRNLTIPAEEFKKELAVVMEERRLRTDDKPRALTNEQFYATAFVSSPYHNPIIGWMNDLKNLGVEDLRGWYQRWYAPNNATLVVVGDVEAQTVFDLAEQYFGKLAPEKIEPLKPRREVSQSGERSVIVKAPAELPYLMMGYKVPVLNTAKEEWEPYALEVLAGILDGSDSARFPRELVREQQVAASVNVGYDLFARQSDLLVIDATPAQGHDTKEVQKAIESQIARVKSELVSDEELARIKAQVLAHKVYEQDSVFYQAMQLGMLETIGVGWRKVDEYPEKVRAITAEQVQAVARKYLIDDGLTVAVLEPQALNEKTLASAKE